MFISSSAPSSVVCPGKKPFESEHQRLKAAYLKEKAKWEAAHPSEETTAKKVTEERGHTRAARDGTSEDEAHAVAMPFLSRLARRPVGSASPRRSKTVGLASHHRFVRLQLDLLD